MAFDVHLQARPGARLWSPDSHRPEPRLRAHVRRQGGGDRLDAFGVFKAVSKRDSMDIER